MNTPRVSDIVVEKIERSILEGTLKPGQRLPAERKFAQQMGVSRPSLREALQKLSARGMLVARRGGGTTVTKSLNPLLMVTINSVCPIIYILHFLVLMVRI